MWNALPLAHGVFGIWDELIPMVLVGSFAMFLIVSAWLSRRNENAQSDDTSITPTDTTPTDQLDSPPDHYRLD